YDMWNFGVMAIVLIAVIMLTACESVESERSEVGTREGNYDRLVEMEPALEVTNTKTRETVNFFTETWNQEGQLAYVYLQNSEGNIISDYSLYGTPVSIFTALTLPARLSASTYDASSRPAPVIAAVERSTADS